MNGKENIMNQGISSTNDTEFITRNELALLMTTIVSHYEKRIQ